MSNKDIARELDISLGTTKAHVHNILSKLNLSSRAQVAARLHRLPR
jgi:Response regulator containing a CheY-like receiver domain and an HTH DNA-binding domain